MWRRRVRGVLGVLSCVTVVACTGPPSKKLDGEDSAAVVAPGTALPPADTAPPPPDSGGDAHGPDLTVLPEPDPGVPLELIFSDEVLCTDPLLRAELGPFALVEDLDGLGAIPPFEGGLPGATMSAALGDVNGDGHIDLLHGHPEGALLFFGRGDGSFVPAPEGAWPVPEAEDLLVSGLVLVDLDDDGDLDALVNHRTHLPMRYQNRGDGTFTLLADLGTEAHATGSVGASVADLNGDGALDLFLGGHQTINFDPSAPPVVMPAALYALNGGVLQVSDTALPERASDGYTFVATLLDLNDDGRTDAYLANDHGSYGAPNALLWGTGAAPEHTLVPDGNEHYLDVHMAGMGIAPGDLNADGVADLAVTNWAGPKLFLSDEVGWFDTALSRGFTDAAGASVGWGTHMGDYDNDGDLDIYTAYGFLPGSSAADLEDGRPNALRQPDAFYENDGSGRFTDVAPALGVDDEYVGRTALMVDLNRDGFLDLYLGRQFRPPKVWMARCSDAHWTTIRLEQPPPNSDAIGAKVQVVSASGVQTRWIQAGGVSFGGSPPLMAHVGLGTDDRVERVVVTWPDGTVTESTGLPSRRELRIRRLP